MQVRAPTDQQDLLEWAVLAKPAIYHGHYVAFSLLDFPDMCFKFVNVKENQENEAMGRRGTHFEP